MASVGDEAPGPPPELIVVAHPEAVDRIRGTRVQGADAAAAPLEQALVETGAHARPLFGPTEERIRARRSSSPWDLPDLSPYYHVSVPADHEAVAARLNEEESVAGAFVKPPVQVDEDVLPASVAADPAAAIAALTPNFTTNDQAYLDGPTVGVNARNAWAQPGGDGTGTHVMVIGGALRTSHEDLVGATGGVTGGQEIDAVSFRNHGTAVVGLVRANRNDRGVTGVAPACEIRLVATFGKGTAAAIRIAADSLPAGGIIVIEWQRPGPGSTGTGAAGFLPLEWWPDDFAAISYATAKGVIVVEPAGNGSVSLDDPFYNTPAPGFPATWKNPFDRTKADCGAILVGAGAPPDNTHGNHHGPDRSRLPTSNYGASLDVQGWGAELTTLGYGDLQGGPDEDIWYTKSFGGTSGAAAMIAGVVASLQGMQLSGGKRPPLTPADVRRLLHQTGSAQQDGPDGPAGTRRIGTRPDLIALKGQLTATKDEAKEAKDNKENKDNKETKDGKDGKDGPDKLNKDTKDNKESKEAKEAKDGKDGKDGKDDPDKQDKDLQKEGPKEISKEDGGIEQPPIAPPVDPPEASVVSHEPVRHFIAEDLRPVLSASHLSREPDFAGRDAAEVADELRSPDPATSGA